MPGLQCTYFQRIQIFSRVLHSLSWSANYFRDSLYYVGEILFFAVFDGNFSSVFVTDNRIIQLHVSDVIDVGRR
jgi:hypothetical protein